MSDLSIDNKFLVGVHGDDILLLRPTQRISKADALNLAAWLVALADWDDEFQPLLEKVQNT